MTAWCVVYERDCGSCDESRHYRRAGALGEYRDAIADPEPDLAAVWVTRQDDYDEWATVVVGHDFRPDPRAPSSARE